MADIRHDRAGPAPVYSAVNPNTGVYGGGSTPASEKPAKVLQESWRQKRDAKDPASDVAGMPPNFGEDLAPHVITFQGIVSSVARVYRPSDEAIKDSFENARFMRNDCSIMECLEQRKRSTALLDWRLEPQDEGDETQKWLCGKLTPLIAQIPRFMQYREALLEALWYGKYAVQHRFRWKRVCGRDRLVIDKWLPVLGDKLVFRYDDGTQTFDPDQVGIRVGAGFTTGSSVAKRWSVDRINKVEPTDYGLAYMLDAWERDLLAIHKHQIEDGEYEEPQNAGRIHGIGIRSRIYWTWYQKQESMAWLMEFLERSAFGIEIWYYPWGNDQAKQRTREAAQERIGEGRNIILVPRPLGEESMAYGVERIEPGMQGADVLKDILANYFGHQIKRYILGQVLTTEAESTGLGSNLASIHLDTYLQIVKYDAINLQETLTTDLVDPLKKLNFPKFADTPIKFVIDTESPDVEGKLAAWRQAFEMGCKLKERDVMDLIGAETPTEEDEFLQDSQAAGAGQEAEQQAQQAQYDMQTAQAEADHQQQLDRQKFEHDKAMGEQKMAIEKQKMAQQAEHEKAKMQADRERAAQQAQVDQQVVQQDLQHRTTEQQMKQQAMQQKHDLAQRQMAQAEQADWQAPDFKAAGYMPKNENAERQKVGQYAKRKPAAGQKSFEFKESDHPRVGKGSPEGGQFGSGEGGAMTTEQPDVAADYRQHGTRSASFKRWFGDWEVNPAESSKVVDENGEPAQTYNVESSEVMGEDGKPRVVYHGTASGGFTEFKKERIAESNLFGAGFYFTEDKEIAGEYLSKGGAVPIAHLKQIVIPSAQRSAYFRDYYNGVSQKSGGNARATQHTLEKESAFMQTGSLYSLLERDWHKGRSVVEGWELEVAESLRPQYGNYTVNPEAEIKELYLNIRNPMDLDRPATKKDFNALVQFAKDRQTDFYFKHVLEHLPPDAPGAATELPDNGAVTWENMQLIVKGLSESKPGLVPLDKPFSWQAMFWILGDTGFHSSRTDVINQYIHSRGYDGISHTGGWNIGEKDHRVWIAFEPNQIKSTDNQGTFDADNPDIRYAAGDQPSDDISPAKARKILDDGEVHGKPLTEAQRGMFGAAAGKYAAGDLFNKDEDTRQAEFAPRSQSTLSGASTPKRHKPLIGQQGLFEGIGTVKPKKKAGAPDDRQQSLFCLSDVKTTEQFAKAYYGESTVSDQDEFWNGGTVGEITTVEDGEPMRYSRDAAGGVSVQRYARFQPDF